MISMRKFFFVAFISLLVGYTLAQSQVDPMDLPVLDQYITDYSNVLTDDQLFEINAMALQYQKETSNQFVAVLFPSRQGNELMDIGMKVFKDAGIGQKDKNNGLLLLISTEEKKIRIIVWYGLEWVYPDLMASRIIENDIRPLVNSWDFYGAVKSFYEKSALAVAWEYVADGQSLLGWDSSSVYIAVILWFFLGMWLNRFLKWGFKQLSKKLKKWIGIWLSVFFFVAFLVWIYFAGMFLISLFFWIIFGLIWIFPWFGRWGFGSWFWWGFGWWGWFSWWGWWSWGGGAGD